MNADRVVRSSIVAAACAATAWWLLHDSPERDHVAVSAPAASADGVLEPSASVSEHAAAVEARDEAPLADVRFDGTTAIRSTAGGASVEPIQMIDGIVLPGGMWNLHRMMEREPRDAAWAEEMERQFTTYFASKPELGRNFSSPSVLCRTRSCEIQAIGYGANAFDTWKTATDDLRDQRWAEELAGGGVYTTERAPNEHAVVLILLRTRRVFRAGAPAPR